jgi:hypothetical protein
VIEVAAPPQRRLAHEALARAWSEAGEPERAAWHLAEAGDGPDAHVSSALADVARAARARAAPAAAAEAWRRAVETAPDADQALRMRFERTRDLAQAGRGSEALGELEEMLDCGCPAEIRADAEVLQGQLLISRGRLDQAARGLQAGAARIRDRDPARAAMMLCGAAFVEASQAEIAAAVATAETAVALARPSGGASAAAAESTLGWILIGPGRGPRLSAAAAARRARRRCGADAGGHAGVLSAGSVRLLDGGLRHGSSRGRTGGHARAREGVSSAACRSR